jgi:hypothetical protein
MIPWPFFWWAATMSCEPARQPPRPSRVGPRREHVRLEASELMAFDELRRSFGEDRSRARAWLRRQREARLRRRGASWG